VTVPCKTVRLGKNNAAGALGGQAAGRSQRKVGHLPWGAYAATAVADDMPATPPLFAAAFVFFL
jgi:hypothetical protein